MRRQPPSDKNREAIDELQEAVNDAVGPDGDGAKRARVRRAARKERRTRGG